MPQLIDRPETNRFIGLFVGESGSGKTAAEASFPKPIHFDDFDGRIGGAQGCKWLDLSGIDYDYYPPKQPGTIQKLNARLASLMNVSALAPVLQLPSTHVTDSITNMTFAFLCQAMGLTHKQGARDEKRGRYIGGGGGAEGGPIAMAGPEDYGLEAQATYDYIAFLKSLPIPNIIISAHIIDRYGKPIGPDGEELTYADSIVVGHKLSIRDKIAENIKSHFDHVFKFERISDNLTSAERFYVTFRGGIARTSYSWLPSGRQDITGREFYSCMMSFRPLAQPEPKGETK